MSRVRLNAGALTAGQLRVGPRGVSERIRPPGDDVNYRSSRDERLVCGWCGSKNLDSSRPPRCSPCRTDQATVREASARLAAAGLPRLGAKNSGDGYKKVRRRGDEARARLAERRKARPQPKRSVPQQPPARPRTTPLGSRRLNDGQKRAGVRRLEGKIDQLQKQLAALPHDHRRRDRLREDLAAARRLLSDWDDGVH